MGQGLNPRLLHKARRSLAPIALLALCQSATAQQVVEVFRLGSQSVTAAPGATVYVLDAMDTYLDKLSVGLPKTEAEAQRIASARLATLTDADKAALRGAAEAKVRAAEYRITHAPAIVFDGRAVIYGVSDVERAQQIYRNWLARRGAS